MIKAYFYNDETATNIAVNMADPVHAALFDFIWTTPGHGGWHLVARDEAGLAVAWNGQVLEWI